MSYAETVAAICGLACDGICLGFGTLDRFDREAAEWISGLHTPQSIRNLVAWAASDRADVTI